MCIGMSKKEMDNFVGFSKKKETKDIKKIVICQREVWNRRFKRF
jgi:hypothetical protein